LEFRRVLFRSVQEVQAPQLGDADARDQFGQRYGSEALAGFVLLVDPLRGPAASAGARLHVRVTSLLLPPPPGDPVPCPPAGLCRPVPIAAGDWSFDVVVLAAAARQVRAPAPVSANGDDYRVTSVTTTGRMLTVRWTVAGPAVERIAGAADA